MPYWIWIGNRPSQYNATANSNLTISEANSIVGYRATGRDELAPVLVNGQTLGGNFQTTFNSLYGGSATTGGTRMNYNSDQTGAVTNGRITTAVQAQFRVTDLDANGNEYVVGTYTGLFVQMNNGDVFFRPIPDTVTQWATVTRIYSIEVLTSTRIADSTAINSTIGFNPSINDVEIVPCFTLGTWIATPSGSVRVEDLKVGDLVLTKDRGPQPVRWIGRRKLSAATLLSHPNLRPIRITAGALGRATPATDLIVSPQHRVLVRSQIAQRMFGASEVLCAAKQLMEVDGIDIALDIEEVEYFHILFDWHEVVTSNGAETESLYTGAQALNAIGPQAKDEIFALFPELRNPEAPRPPARPLLSGRVARKMAVRHITNAKALIN